MRSFQVARSLRPLPAETVLAGAELARQPLLLLMLALYDADGNALQAAQDDLGHAQLYERLLIRFAEREVRKTRSGLDDEQIRQEIERELLRLSVAAFAMFNRNRQWATEHELNSDLEILLGGNDSQAPQHHQVSVPRCRPPRSSSAISSSSTRPRPSVMTYG